MYDEAIRAYKILIEKNKKGEVAGGKKGAASTIRPELVDTHIYRVRVNLGNLYMEQGAFNKAVINYNIALDNTPPNPITRMRIERNIGIALVRMAQLDEAELRKGKYGDAIEKFERIMATAPNFPTGFNLLLCYFALGDTVSQLETFKRLLHLDLPLGEEKEEMDTGEEEEEEGGGLGAEEGGRGGGENKSGSSGRSGGANAQSGDDAKGKGEGFIIGKLHPRDSLRDYLNANQSTFLNMIKTGARLIAPGLFPSKGWAAGFDTLVDLLSLNYPHCASEVQIAKALEYLRRKQFDRAIEVLKSFEKKDTSLKAKAAINLSFLYLLEGATEQACNYAEMAVKTDRYNARALVNLGNALVEGTGELERAKELYLEAIGVEADCIEAIFNLGLVNENLGATGEAVQAFEKLHTLVPSSPEVLYHLAILHESLGNMEAAQKYSALLVTRTPTDSGALARLGQLYARMSTSGGGGKGGGPGQARYEEQVYQYTSEAYRVFPVNLEVISWLGVWYVKSEMYEKAISFFQRASELQPNQVKWKLMMASCLRCVPLARSP